MTKFKVIHYKKDCISCGACAAISPNYWEMDEEGLAQLKNSKEVDDHWEFESDSYEVKVANQEAADVCPVQIIHVKDEE